MQLGEVPKATAPVAGWSAGWHEAARGTSCCGCSMHATLLKPLRTAALLGSRDRLDHTQWAFKELQNSQIRTRTGGSEAGDSNPYSNLGRVACCRYTSLASSLSIGQVVPPFASSASVRGSRVRAGCRKAAANRGGAHANQASTIASRSSGSLTPVS